MAYYDLCLDCGATLDPGEKCDCQIEKIRRKEFFTSQIKMEAGTRQMVFAFAGMGGEDGKEGPY